MNILITGASGFIGRNLLQHLKERKDVTVVCFAHGQPLATLAKAVSSADSIIHLAGVNRPNDHREFATGNFGFTDALCQLVKGRMETGSRVSAVVYASSIQAERDNDYGNSKRKAEEALARLGRETGLPIHIYRLPNVFGKWSRPNYNSAIATFCHNLVHQLPLQINDPNALLKLAYVDDVVDEFIEVLDGKTPSTDEAGFALVHPVYEATVGEVAALLTAFSEGREKLLIEDVGSGLKRALYATIMSFCPPQRFSYPIVVHADPRGSFAEMLKTPHSGQFSFFTAHPGVTRGGHYHHTKCEKFLVLKGHCRFRFRQVDTGEVYELHTDGHRLTVVDTVPGWTHDVTNIGEDEMIVMLWASERYDRSRPDTYVQQL